METDERYPALRRRTRGRVDRHVDVDGVRRQLWRAYQAGKFSEAEFASTLDRLDWWAGREEQLQRDDRCEHCQLLGIHVLQAEQTVARLQPVRIWRHTKCQHVFMWRGGGSDVVSEPPAQSPISNVLSTREREVAALIARGLTNRQIADTLVITRGTAANHVARILSKLNANNRAQAAVQLSS